MEPENPLLDDFILELAGKACPKICFLPTASGDSAAYIERFYAAFQPPRSQPAHLSLFSRTVGDLRAFLMAQDVVYVGGGNTANMLAVWRAHGLDRVLREVWEAGVILGGLSAGSVCWFEAGVTDSFGHPLVPFRDTLGFLPGSHCPHYDSEAERRIVYPRCVGEGLPAGFAVDDGAALVFAGTELLQVVSSRPSARAYRVERSGDSVVELLLRSSYLGRSDAHRELSEP